MWCGLIKTGTMLRVIKKTEVFDETKTKPTELPQRIQSRWDLIKEISQCLVSKSIELGGTATGEHGIGLGKRKSWLPNKDPACIGWNALNRCLIPMVSWIQAKFFHEKKKVVKIQLTLTTFYDFNCSMRRSDQSWREAWVKYERSNMDIAGY